MILQSTVLRVANMVAFVGLFICTILSNPAITVLYLVSLLFAPPIPHPTDDFLDRKAF